MSTVDIIFLARDVHSLALFIATLRSPFQILVVMDNFRNDKN